MSGSAGAAKGDTQTPDPIRILPLPGVPGIQKDGTQLETDRYSDGTWVRFNNRGNPRKMGGFRRMTDALSNPSRGIWVGSNDASVYIHSGQLSGIELTTYDTTTGVPTSGVIDRGPVGLVDYEDYIWTFDQMFNPGGSNSAVFAHAARNGVNIASSAAGTIFYADAYNGNVGTSGNAFVPIGASDPHDSGGILCMHPFLFSFGNFGTIHWSTAADPTLVGTNAARIAEQKIVAGLSTRGGSGASPAGLFWSLNSLIRATFVGGSAQFDFDTISDRVSIASSRSVIELDGTYYWASTGRFMRYNGVIQECANNQNVDDFFFNLNIAARQRVWAHAVPQWGEVWWFYPRGTATECNHAVIYNKRLSESLGRPVWYDTEVPLGGYRSAGVRTEVFPWPVLAGATPLPNGSKNSLYQHETGRDAVFDVTLPIRSNITTCNITTSVGQADSNVRLTRFEPDMRQAGVMTVERITRSYARSPTQSVVATFDETTKKVDDIRGQGREMMLKFSNDALGGFYEFGKNLIHVEPGDKRVSSE